MKRAAMWVSCWLPVLLWCVLIFYLSSIPNLRFIESWWDHPIRKLGHMGVFGILARLLARAWTGTSTWSWRKIFVWALVFTFLYACSDEFHQTFVPGRLGCVSDVLIDTVGAWVSLGFLP